MTLHRSMKLIGIGDNGLASLLPQYHQWIEDCEVLVGGERVLDFFPHFTGKKSRSKEVFQHLLRDCQRKQEIRLFSHQEIHYFTALAAI